MIDAIKARLRKQVVAGVLTGWYTLAPAGNTPRLWCLNPSTGPAPPYMQTDAVLLWLDGIEETT